jgi:hypothetical protein
MAFLTNYNFQQLSKKVHINEDVSLKMFLDKIYDDPEIYLVLNKIEVEFLFKYKMLLENEEKFFIEYYKEVPIKEDTKEFVFNKGGKMKYHLNSECSLLLRDYLDFGIPDEIKEFGDDAVDEYRKWFNDNNFGDRFRYNEIVKNTIINAFNSKYPKKYNIKPIEANSNLLVIEAPNSNIHAIKSELDLKNAKINLSILKEEWLVHFPCSNTRIIAKHKHLLNKTNDEIIEKISELFSPVFIKNFGYDKLISKFTISKRLTYQMISILLEIFKWTYDLKDKNFHRVTLEKFGLMCCLDCRNESME